ncbi:MAG: hypothetical protein JSU68_08170, partial [Phycisphaerales bacterium]
MRTRIVWCGILVIVCALQAGSTQADEQAAALEVKDRLLAEVPGARFHTEDGRLTRIYGQAMTFGLDPTSSAERFRLNYAATFGVDPDDLVLGSVVVDGRQTLPLMYDRQTGQYKFTLLYYGQQREGIPVYGSEMRLLVANDVGHPVVWAASSLHKLGDFAPQRAALPAQPELALAAARTDEPALANFTEPRTVIWAGDYGEDVSPVMALTFIGDNLETAVDVPQKFRFVANAATGEILHKEDMIIFEDVVGNVSGMATMGPAADYCTDETQENLRYARVNIGTTEAFADIDGNFTIPNAGTSPVTVESRLLGPYFICYNYVGSDELLSQSVTPPGPADFLHNAANTDELVRAQVNGYLHANIVRDFILENHPTYPIISTQTDMPVYVNRTDGYCPGNAWYDYTAINFCQSGSGYPNTAWSSVIYHEYGHHVVYCGGSGQDQYGEGMADSVGLLILDDPRLGLGFPGSCDQSLRTADNTYQYPCTGTAHDCGQLLSGCIWDTREELAITNPTTYLEILSALTVNSVPMHSGTQITPQITIDFLTLDDDNGNIDDGTPHSTEIYAGFGAHNMIPLPPPDNDDCADAIVVCPGAYSGSTTSATNDGSSSCGDSASSPDVWYSYTPLTNGSLTASLCSGTAYDSVLSIHSGCPGTSANDLGCDDDGCGSTGGPSTVTISVTTGNTYLIRVTGWSGSVGDFTLTITGPDCDPGDHPLFISFPSGLPEYLDPGAATSFDVLIEDGTENYVAGSGTLHYRYDGGSWLTSSLPSLGGDLYQATLPPAACDDTPEFYISAEGDGGST